MMLKVALFDDLRLASEALENEHPMSSYRLLQLAGIIVADVDLCERIVYLMGLMQQVVEEIDAAGSADVNDE